MIELKPDQQKTFFKQRAYRLKHSPKTNALLLGCAMIYFVSVIAFCFLLPTLGRAGLIAFGLWLTMPMVYVLIRDLYIAWYLGNTSLMVSNETPQTGQEIEVAFAQTFSQPLIIEMLTFDLIMHESRTGPNTLDVNDIVQTISQSDQPVVRGETFKTQVTLLIPPDARPTKKSPEDYAYTLQWLIRVTLKCKAVFALTEDYPLVVVDGDTES
jgi:hypothetical protein